MSRMPTMSNYTMFHEWLNKFLPGIYSDDFSLTPGTFSDFFNTLLGIYTCYICYDNVDCSSK